MARRRTFLITVLLTVAAVLGAAASAEATFRVSTLVVNPSTKQAAGHPNLTVSFTRTGAPSEDLRDLTFDAPPGMHLNPQASASQCSAASFEADACPAASVVGSAKTTLTVESFFSFRMIANGTIYRTAPIAGAQPTWGYILRPSGLDRMRISASVDYRDGGMRISMNDVPRTLGVTPITVESISSVFNARTGAAKNGPYFTLNPSSCASGQAKLEAVSYQGVSSSVTKSLAMSNCSRVATTAGAQVAYDSSIAGASTGWSFGLDVPTADATIQKSTLRDVSVTLQPGAQLDVSSLPSPSERCSEAQFAVDACPASARVAHTATAIPLFPSNLTGDVYLLQSAGSALPIGAIIHRPAGSSATLRGALSNVGSGPAAAAQLTLSAMPQIPRSSLDFEFDRARITLPFDCAARSAAVAVKGHSGTSASLSVPTAVTQCLLPPDTQFTVIPPTPGGDSTPAFAFTGTHPGDTFECSIDGGPWTPCTPPITLPPLPDGTHQLCVRARNAAGPDPTPACFVFVVDTRAPSIAIGPNFFPLLFFSVDEPADTECQIDGGAWFLCTSPVPVPTDPGVHTVCVRATDAAGNVGTVCLSYAIDPPLLDTEITNGPSGGLAITDQTPTFDFEDPFGFAEGFECRIDGGAWFPCISPITLPPLANGLHEFQVRATRGDGAVDDTPAFATFEVADFAPSLTVTPSSSQAAAHPDLEIDLQNPAGDPSSLTVDLSNGMWIGVASATPCTLADAASHACSASARVGSVETSYVDDTNTTRGPLVGDVYATEPVNAGDMGGLAIDFGQIAFDGTDYGRLIAIASLDDRYDSFDPEVRPVGPPNGSRVTFTAIPSSTAANPGPDGTTNVHLRHVTIDLLGDEGGYAAPLVTNPSSCDEYVALSEAVDTEGNPVVQSQVFQATGCNLVPFAPTVSLTPMPGLPGTNTTLGLAIDIPADHSTLRHARIELPVSLQPQFLGLASSCLPPDTQRIPPACDTATTGVGSVTVSTPLAPVPLSGNVFLEDSGNALPSLYAHVSNAALGVDWRIRAALQTIGAPSRIALDLNAESNGSPSDLPDVPISNIAFDLPGSTSNGPIVKVGTACRDFDQLDATLTAWTGAVVSLVNPVFFNPACPN